MTLADAILALGYLCRDGGTWQLATVGLELTLDGLDWNGPGPAPTLADLEAALPAAQAWAASLAPPA